MMLNYIEIIKLIKLSEILLHLKDYPIDLFVRQVNRHVNEKFKFKKKKPFCLLFLCRHLKGKKDF